MANLWSVDRRFSWRADAGQHQFSALCRNAI
jgi:hypothetical protein